MLSPVPVRTVMEGRRANALAGDEALFKLLVINVTMVLDGLGVLQLSPD